MKIWINGCFDILHHGHFQMIRYARSLGDELVVGIDTDERVKQLKGEDRPYHTHAQRKYNLYRLKDVTKVVMFGSDEELIWHIENENPHTMVIGSDYKDKKIIGFDLFKNIVYFDRNNNLSTTNIISYENRTTKDS